MADPEKFPERDESRNELTGSAGAKRSWRDRYPGWETYEGKANDPRLDSTDPNTDPRYDTHLHSNSTLPRGSAAMWLWLVVLGIVLMTLFAVAMFRHFQQPAPRSPDQGNRSSVSEPYLGG